MFRFSVAVNRRILGRVQKLAPLLLCALASCSVTKLPICPKVAERSYPKSEEGAGKQVGKRVSEELKRRKIRVYPHSVYAASFWGTQSQIKWLRSNYASLYAEDLESSKQQGRISKKSFIKRVNQWITWLDNGCDRLIIRDSNFLQCCMESVDSAPSQPEIITVRLPLCSKLASLSYSTIEEGRGKLIGRFLLEQTTKRKIQINPLSAFVAEFSGNRSEIEWLKRNYASLLCAFNPALVIDDEGVFLSCNSHVKDWIILINSGQEKDLMLDKYLYCPNCCGSAE